MFYLCGMEQNYYSVIRKELYMKIVIYVPLLLLFFSCSSQNISGTSSDVDIQISEIREYVCVIG